ncbi:MAG: EAL domain-containing protein [Epsilonproteobacteria bacterium]|nr:EAL domain-containing protein [Campylobacterota bacterium]
MSSKLRYIYFFVALLTLLFNIYFIYDQWKHMTLMRQLFAYRQAVILEDFVKAFRRTYQKRFLEGCATVNDKNIKILPVLAMADISEKFSRHLQEKASIRTVSDRPGDPKNMARGLELESIRFFRSHPKARAFYQSIRQEDGEQFFYASPLYITRRCLKCHGKKEEAPLYIREHYKGEYGYREGDLKGIIAIRLSQNGMKKSFERMAFVNIVKIVLGSLVFLVAFYFLLRRYYRKEQMYTLKLETEVARKTASLKKRTAELHHRYYHDELTSLPNRNALLKELKKGEATALVLINIDDFNEVNDFYGHRAGDLLILQLSEILTRWVEKRRAMLFRMPSDEFAMLFYEPFSLEEMSAEIEKIVMAIHHHTFVVEGEEIHLRVAAGVSMESSDMLVTADMAIKKAKAEKRDFVIFERALNIGKRYRENIEWAERLKYALDEDRIVPYFQPLVSIGSGKVEKYEALVRLIDRDGRVHVPDEFLDIAKKTRFYPHLTRRMIHKTFEGFEHLPYDVSINLSYRDIVNAETMEFMIEEMKRYGLFGRVQIEILEHEGIVRFDEVTKTLQRFRELGVRVALDDFGSGYSNFTNVYELEIDLLKIDGSLIRQLDREESCRIMVETIVDFAGKLGIETCAEFVTDAKIYEIVRHMGIDYIQGYYPGEPKPLDDLV